MKKLGLLLCGALLTSVVLIGCSQPEEKPEMPANANLKASPVKAGGAAAPQAPSSAPAPSAQ